MTTIVMAAGLCSAIRPKLLTAFPPKRYPNVKITAWGEGHWHIPCPDSQIFPDADIWVKKHVAHIEVNGAPSFASWVEYVACRAIAAENGKAGTMFLMSTPLDERNIKWAAKWATLPEPGEWRQAGCKHKAPKQAAKAEQRKAAPTKKAGKRAKVTKRSGGLNVAGWLDPLRRR
jgi:hypothetical protein